jgi:hypothetical protein
MVGDRETDLNDRDIDCQLLEIWWQHQEHRTCSVLPVWDPPSGEDTQVRED